MTAVSVTKIYRPLDHRRSTDTTCYVLRIHLAQHYNNTSSEDLSTSYLPEALLVERNRKCPVHACMSVYPRFCFFGVSSRVLSCLQPLSCVMCGGESGVFFRFFGGADARCHTTSTNGPWWGCGWVHLLVYYSNLSNRLTNGAIDALHLLA